MKDKLQIIELSGWRIVLPLLHIELQTTHLNKEAKQRPLRRACYVRIYICEACLYYTKTHL